jgi:(R)-2-hydroxyacyl-CoA dehydratese activating ATPase
MGDNHRDYTGGFYGGCDVGSTTGKAVILNDGEDNENGLDSGHEYGIVATALIPSLVDPEETARIVLDAALDQVESLHTISDLRRLVGTGYGRNEVPFAHENISEITCHSVGAHHCDPAIRTLVDIGGQDVKAIALHPDGAVREFAMNDKCAAGTGRFYEAMARIFQLSIEDFSALSESARRVVPVTSQCSVFAETEVVSLLAKREVPADIAAGIQSAVAKRVFALARRVGVQPRLAVTGGCAKNRGLTTTLRKALRTEISPLKVDPQLIGALGAAVLARRRHLRRQQNVPR